MRGDEVWAGVRGKKVGSPDDCYRNPLYFLLNPHGLCLHEASLLAHRALVMLCV